MAELLDVLGARRGVVCLVGAGGKKTTMYRLAALHPGRVALSSTSHMYAYDRAHVDTVIEIADSSTVASLDEGHRVVAYAGRTDTPKRVGGLSAERIQSIWSAGGFDLFLIKADGARARWIKAPAAYEPLIPDFTDRVVPVVSGRVIGRMLEDGIAHRPELLATIMGVRLDQPLEPAHLARLLVDERGALKGVGDAAVTPLINMVDDARILDAARRTAELALAHTRRFNKIVLASMKEGRVVDVVERA